MTFQNVLSAAVGIAVFVFGMLLMKYSLEIMFGKKLEEYMRRLTVNRLSGILTGAFVTVMLQSSSASSVLTATLVDSGMLSLWGAFWIIVGANIGTAFTGLLTAFSFTETAPVFAVAGIALLSLTKKRSLYAPSLFLTGFGLLFVGMNTMSSAAEMIKEAPAVFSLLASCTSPVSGILTGCFVTAVIQSSSAITALLQTLASQGVIGIRQAFFIILGSNIGTCATCAVASIGLKNGAKKVSMMHIIYNLAGAVLFAVISDFIPLPELSERYFPGNIRTQIAFINIAFNIFSALPVVFIPVKAINRIKRKCSGNALRSIFLQQREKRSLVGQRNGI